MTVSIAQSIEQKMKDLVEQFSKTVIEREKLGGTAKIQRDLIRKSGLLGLLTAEKLGGYEKNWVDILAITKEIARVDSSLAHLFGYHFLCLATVELYSGPEKFNAYAQKTAVNQLFWGNAFNPLDPSLQAYRVDDGFKLSGLKSFCSGATDSDLLLVSATVEQSDHTLIAVIPTSREGVHIKNDWDGFGQRQTDSGRVAFENVYVHEAEILVIQTPETVDLKSTIRTHFAQSILNQVLLGTAEGALDAARQYTTGKSKAWLTAPVSNATDDAYILRHYGEFFVRLQAANALNDKAVGTLQRIWDQRNALTVDLRGECSIEIATAKVQIVQTALQVTSEIFETMGASATSGKYNFDRYWRNVRTHSLHDPIDYKIRDIGHYFLNQEYPAITPYS